LTFAVVGLGYLLFVAMNIFGGARESAVTNYPLACAAKVLRCYEPTYVVPGVTFPVSGYVPSAGTRIPVVHNEPPVKSIIYQAFSPGFGATPLGAFFVVGHCFFSWLFAVLAAWFAGRMYDRRERAISEAK
jgi:hypothetical protein